MPIEKPVQEHVKAWGIEPLHAHHAEFRRYRPDAFHIELHAANGDVFAVATFPIESLQVIFNWCESQAAIDREPQLPEPFATMVARAEALRRGETPPDYPIPPAMARMLDQLDAGRAGDPIEADSTELKARCVCHDQEHFFYADSVLSEISATAGEAAEREAIEASSIEHRAGCPIADPDFVLPYVMATDQRSGKTRYFDLEGGELQDAPPSYCKCDFGERLRAALPIGSIVALAYPEPPATSIELQGVIVRKHSAEPTRAEALGVLLASILLMERRGHTASRTISNADLERIIRGDPIENERAIGGADSIELHGKSAAAEIARVAAAPDAGAGEMLAPLRSLAVLLATVICFERRGRSQAEIFSDDQLQELIRNGATDFPQQ